MTPPSRLLIPLLMVMYSVPCSPSTTYTDGTIGKGDVVIVDCLYDIRGTLGEVLNKTFTLLTETPGTVITYINVSNLKKAKEQGTINRREGGVSNWYVSFDLQSKKGHGFKFNFKLYGHPAKGKVEASQTGDCKGK